MPTQTNPAVNLELRSAGFVSGGLAATTTVKTVGLLPGTKYVSLAPHNLSATTVAVSFGLNPWLTILKTTDGGATFTDYSEVAQNDLADSGVVLSSLPTLANGGALFIGSHVQFRGLQIDVSAVNATANLLTAEYYNNTTWADLDDTDGTASGGAALAQDGAYTFASVPSAWVTASLETIMGKPNEAFGSTFVKPVAGIRTYTQSLYWARLQLNAAFDSATTVHQIHALNRSVSYAQVSGNVPHQQSLHRGQGGFGSIEYRTDTGTADLLVNVGSGNGYFGD
jgi:hypothetical protein